MRKQDLTEIIFSIIAAIAIIATVFVTAPVMLSNSNNQSVDTTVGVLSSAG